MLRWLLLCLPLWLGAQSPGASGLPPEGVYLTHAALLAGRPDVPWSDIAGEMVQLAQDRRLQIDGFSYKSGSDYGRPYAVVLDGQPFLFVHEHRGPSYHEFAGIEMPPGRYATIRYDTVVSTRQLMRAYNPANGQAFREAWVERDRRHAVRRIVDMASGRRHPFNRPTVLRLVGEEADLRRAVERLTDGETDKLLRALELYNERHPLVPTN